MSYVLYYDVPSVGYTKIYITIFHIKIIKCRADINIFIRCEIQTDISNFTQG
jgi:hypothetical protein